MSTTDDNKQAFVDQNEMNAYTQGLEVIDRNMKKDFNVIPSSFPRMSKFYPGVEWGTYNVVTASSGVGKSQFSDFHFVHEPVNFYYQNPDKIRVKIFYHSLEMAPAVKALQFVAHKIYRDTGQRIGIKKMMKISGELSKAEYDLVRSYKDYFDWFFKVVELSGAAVSPFALFKQIDNFYKANGTIIRKDALDHKWDPKLKKDVASVRKIVDRYEANDKDLMVILVIDHVGLITPQKDQTLWQSLGKLSSYMVQLRNLFGLTVCWIQQQASDQESKDNYKKPTMSGLGDNKSVQRDADNIFGIYDPFRHNDRSCNGWDVNKMNQRYRELILLKSRYGPANMKTDLMYDGTTEMFLELPNAMTTDPEIVNKWLDYAKNLPIIM